MTSINFRSMTAILALGMALPVEANLISNGSFETGINAPTGSPNETVSVDSTSAAQISNWTVGDGTNIDWILDSYWDASDGNYSIDLNGTAPGTISTSAAFSTVTGTEYVVKFDLAGNPDGGPTVKDLRAIAVDGNDFDTGTILVSEAFSFDITGQAKDNMGWTEEVFTFIASSAITKLGFISDTSGSYGPALDNVSVNAVPIPASIWLLGSSLLGLLGLGKRWKTT